MTLQRLVTSNKYSWIWHNQGMHHCHYELGTLYAHVKQMHTYFSLTNTMQDIIFNFYMLFGKAVCTYALSL